MANPVFGSRVTMEMQLDDLSWIDILCAQTISFSRVPEVINITSPSSGIWRSKMIRREEWSMSISGLTKIENDTSTTFFYMLTTGVRRDLLTVRITFEDELGDDKQIEGNVYVGRCDITTQVTDFSSCTIEFVGTDEFTISAVEDPGSQDTEVYGDYWATTNGQSYISGASSGQYDGINYTLGATDVVLEVMMEGLGYELVSGTPTAGERECKWNTSNTRVEFPSDVVFDGSQRVMVLFKRIT